MKHPRTNLQRFLVTSILLSAAIAPAVRAQQPAPVRPPDKPPIAQGWIDIATFASPGGMGGIAGMMMGGGGGDPPMSV